MRDFEIEFARWMEKHKAASKGERLRRLNKRYGFGEKLFLRQVWWPLFGALDELHPEYEIVGSDGTHYFVDHAYLRLPQPTALESDGYDSHARDIDRDDFSDGLDRQNEILLKDWHVATSIDAVFAIWCGIEVVATSQSPGR